MRLINSFRYAGSGLWDLFARELNFRVDLAVFEVVLGSLYLLRFPTFLTSVAFIVAVLVLAAEAFNTALERTLDLLGERSISVGRAKDQAAAAVLIMAFGAAALGIILGARHIPEVLSLAARHPGVPAVTVGAVLITLFLPVPKRDPAPSHGRQEGP